MFQFSALALFRVTGLQPVGLSHSDTCGSSPVCRSPHIFAAYRVLRRRQKPRHPPFALCNFSCCESYLQIFIRRYVLFLLYEKVIPNFFRFYRLSFLFFYLYLFSLNTSMNCALSCAVNLPVSLRLLYSMYQVLLSFLYIL